MGRGQLRAHLEAIEKEGAWIADERREGYDKQYEYSDVIKGANEIFFFQHPSMLEYQERLKRKREWCNAETILKAGKIPSANHMTRLLDKVAPEDFTERYQWLDPIVLGDDIYADYPTCAMVVEKGLYFLFTCKPSSHQWLHDSIDGQCMERKMVRKWNGRKHLEYRYQWHSGLEIREEAPTLAVNYLLLEIWNEEKGKATYRNSWATGLAVDDTNVAEMAECARARWKIENEHNNVLKHHG